MSKYAENKKEYVRSNPARRQLSNKLSWIKKRYGQNAKEYFVNNPRCESCPERRLTCLAVHHVEGKTKEVFKVLCHNCHSIEHSKGFTIEDALKGLPLIERGENLRCGTLNMYNHYGCRCDLCKEAKRVSRK
jgi:hypothetical protein